MKNTKLTKSAKALLEYLQSFPVGEPITAKQKELAKALNCTVMTIFRALEQLQQGGYIRIISGKEDCKANTYFVNSAPEPKQEIKNVPPPATVISKDFTPKAHAILKNFIPPEEEKKEQNQLITSEDDEKQNEIISVSAKIPEEAEQYIACIESLKPYIETELLQFQKLHPEMNLTLQGVLDCMDITGNVIDAQKQEITMLIEKAKEKHEADANKEKISVTAKKPEAVPFLLDKVSQNIFKHLEAGTYSVNVEKSGSNDNLNTIITLDFEELESNKALTFRPLTPFDKRVYVAIGALWHAGNEYITIQQIHRAMGGKGSPSMNQINAINEAISKLMKTTIKIDNQEESESYNYPHFVYDSSLLPAEKIQELSINNRIAKHAIHLFREPPLLTFARKRKQITTYTLEQFTLPFARATEDNLLLDDYFRNRIARMKRDKEKKKPYNNKMLYTTIYENCGIDTRKKRYDATTKFRKLLDHYQKTGIITGYQEQQDGIIIIL